MKRRYTFNKLIRSKIPGRMHQEGVHVTGRALGQQEYIKQLKHKIVEEANEVAESDSRSALLSELADVLEAVNAIADAYEISFPEIEKERLHKLDINGYFSPLNYVDYIEVDEENREIIEYLENKHRPYEYK